MTGNSTVGAFNYIEGITVDANGIVWIADTDNNRIVSYNPTTRAMTAFGTRGKNAVVGTPAQFIDPAVGRGLGYRHVRCRHRQQPGRRSRHERRLSSRVYASLDAPQGIALSPDGTLWVADTGTSATDTRGNQIVHLSSTLANLDDGFGGPGTGTMQFDLPHSLAVSPSGSTLFVADTYNNRVQEFNITGS